MGAKKVPKTEATVKKTLPLDLPKETHYKLKLLAIKLDTSMNELCREGIHYIFKKYEKQFDI